MWRLRHSRGLQTVDTQVKGRSGLEGLFATLGLRLPTNVVDVLHVQSLPSRF